MPRSFLCSVARADAGPQLPLGLPVSARPSLSNVAPGGSPDVSCSVEIGPCRFAAAYEVLGALEDYAVAQAWARWWWVKGVSVLLDGDGCGLR